MNKNVVLKECKGFEEDNHLYLKLVYEYEDEHGVCELIIPKLDLEIRTDYLPNILHDVTTNSHDKYFVDWENHIFSLSTPDVTVNKNDKPSTYQNVFYVVSPVKENIHEMTLAEIEKKLGYKIKLVSEETV